MWDLGGQSSIRPYWRCYYPNTDAVIFVVDSTDIERLEVAKAELFALLEVRGEGGKGRGEGERWYILSTQINGKREAKYDVFNHKRTKSGTSKNDARKADPKIYTQNVI